MKINPPSAEWIRDEIVAAVAPLRRQLDEQDEWMNGLFLLLDNLIRALAKEQPQVLRRVIPQWEEAAQLYELARQGLYSEQSAERLEPRKLMYRLLLTSGALRHLDG